MEKIVTDKKIVTDICVIGAGSAGLSLAAGAVQMGADVVLIERGKMGGDCLNYGCVPSKSLLAAAKSAWSARHHSAEFGVICKDVSIDFEKTHAHVRSVISSIAPHDSESRFRSLGVRVIKGSASFTGRGEVAVGDHSIRARYFAIATGSSPFIPSIEGLQDMPYLTNETIFSLRHCPRHLLVLGAGPIGCELAQAFVRLGAEVTLVSRGQLLPREDSESVSYVRRMFKRDKIKLVEDCEPLRFSMTKGGILRMEYSKGGKLYKLSGSHLLVATGRLGNVAGLNLSAAGVEFADGVIKVDARLRTSNKRIFALGDIRGNGQFTHLAGYDAGIVIRNILFRLRSRVSGRGGHSLLPRITYTDPEVAAAGLSESEAISRFGESGVRVVRSYFSDNDRARAERYKDGMIKVVTDRRGLILGVSLCGRNSGELLLPWIMALSDGKRIGSMAGYIVPYPTLSEISKRVAGEYFTARLFSERTRRIVRSMLRWFG